MNRDFYMAQYKCRMCGEKYFSGTGTGSREVAEVATFAVTGGRPFPMAPSLYEAHKCKDGHIGVADFTGFIKEETQT